MRQLRGEIIYISFDLDISAIKHKLPIDALYNPKLYPIAEGPKIYTIMKTKTTDATTRDVMKYK